LKCYKNDFLNKLNRPKYSKVIRKKFNNSLIQTLIDLQAIPKWSKQIKTNGFVGDFLAMISRNNIDSKLAHYISNSWSMVSKQTPYKLSELSITSLGHKTPDFDTLSNHANLLRSDHIMFWYPNSTLYNDTLKAVLITDTGNPSKSFSD